jgi:IS1 family transposase
MVAGDRSEFTARCLWDALPDDYRAGAVVFSDFWAAYAAVIPEAQHVACGKGDGMTCHVERFWCTVRQRCARFVRKTPSFSRCTGTTPDRSGTSSPLQRVTAIGPHR